LAKHLFKSVLGKEFTEAFPRMSYADAMEYYGSDKPDIRFDMKMNTVTDMLQGNGFSVFDEAEYIGAIAVKGCAGYTRKQLDEITEWVKRPQVGAKGLVYIKLNADGIKSSIDKFYTAEQLKVVADKIGAAEGDLILILSGAKKKMQGALGTLRLEMGNRLGLRDNNVFAPLWVCDFPLLEWDDETQRFYAMHHPFTSPKPEDMDKFFSNKKEDLEQVNANAYDFVLNGTEVGGGSIRIHDSKVQERMFEVLGFSKEDADYRFGFIINAFKYGAPPHGGLAFGFDRFCSLFGGQETIRDFIAFPKNNMGRDVMLDAPSRIDNAQMDELFLVSTAKTEE
jgi:aspartyl-tRNA synthetase